MEKEVGAFEAKTQLSKLLARVERGEAVTITRHGTPIARLVPARASAGREIQHIIQSLREIRERTKPGAPSLRDLRDEGRRF